MSAITAVPTGTYNVDPTHSNVGFEIKHMGIATVRGKFTSFEGTLEVTDGGFSAQGSVDVASIDTSDENRDPHLRSGDFFDAEQFPKITFSATNATIAGEDITVDGELTIKGVTKPVSFKGEILNGGEDPWGNQRAGVEVETTIDRTDFGLSFNQTLPGGNLMVANKVKLVVSVSAVKA